MSYLHWIDALKFETYGQWKADTQFTHLMGSGYLLACHAPGKPVEDAVTHFTVPRAGHYRVWARAKNWYYQYAPGKFCVMVDGEKSGVVLGALPSSEWVWQIAGDFALEEGEHALALHDLTGYFGRCSSVIVTDDMDFVPARPVDEFERQRARLLGISLELKEEGAYDVIVVGAGPGGVPAAVAAARAGAKYRIGREANWQHGEPFAPAQPDLLTMSGTLMNPQMVDTGHPVKYEAPEWVTRLPEGRKFGRNIEHIGMVWWAEAPNVLDDVFDAELARDEIFRVYLAYFNYLKNLWEEKEKAANYEFRFMNHIDAKRESRRVMGDYLVTQNDCMAGTVFPDTVGHTGWPIDLHHPKGIYSGEEGPFFSNTHVPMACIPYRSLYSVNIENLFMAGRNISVTHVALGTARLQGTIANLGQAAGTAAAMCVKKGVTPRALGQNHIDELRQRLLRDDQYIPGLRTEDAADLARACEVAASSESAGEPYVWRLGVEAESLPLDRQRATFFARGVSSAIPSVWLQLTNETDRPVPLTVHVREQADPDGYTTQEDLCTVTRDVPPGGEHWVEFPLGLTVEKRYLWLWTQPTPGLSWRVLRFPPLDWTRSERVSDAEKLENIRNEAHSVSLIPPVLETANCAAANVVNGYSRDAGPEHHLWASDPDAALPQWLELRLPAPHSLTCVQLTFDTDMTNNAMLVPLAALPRQLVTDYRLEAETPEGWKLLAEVRGNFLRRRVHRFAPVTASRVRVTVTGSGDGRTARIFEVRLYDEPDGA